MFLSRHRGLATVINCSSGSSYAGSTRRLRREMGMKSFPLKVAVGLKLLWMCLSGPAHAQSTDNDGCTNATLTGDYAFTISGQIFVPNGPVIQREGIAMTHFDGADNLSQVDLVLSSPNAVAPPGFALPTDSVTGFHTQEKGTYTIYSDCTGTFTINFPPATSSVGNICGAIIVAKFVLSNGGRLIHTIVTSLTPPRRAGTSPSADSQRGTQASAAADNLKLYSLGLCVAIPVMTVPGLEGGRTCGLTC